MENELVRGAAPPERRHVLEIVRVKTSEQTHYVCFSEAIYGQLIHWYGNRSHECVADKKRLCNGCQKAWPTKWLGYLHVQAFGADTPVFLEITAVCWQKLLLQIPKGENLRGVQFKIRKTKGGAKGRFLVEVLERRYEDSMLQQEKDPYEVLKYLWSCKRPAHDVGPLS